MKMQLQVLCGGRLSFPVANKSVTAEVRKVEIELAASLWCHCPKATVNHQSLTVLFYLGDGTHQGCGSGIWKRKRSFFCGSGSAKILPLSLPLSRTKYCLF